MNQFALTCVLVVSFTLASGRPQQGNIHAEDANLLHYLYFPTPGERAEIIYNDTQSLQESNLKPSTKTLLLLDGLTSFENTAMNLATKNAFAGREDTNVIIVDWSAYSGYGLPIDTPERIVLVYNYVILTTMSKAASDLADFIQFLHLNKGISYSDITIIGHSLGCHTAGVTGRYTKAKYNNTVGRIVAEDPAVQVSIVDHMMRLRIGDADVVEVYNTNRGLAGDMYPATGDVTIYVNGGDNQPCQRAPRKEKAGNIENYPCESHGFSYRIYNYLLNNETITACPCQGAMCLCQGCEFECGDKGIKIGPHIPETARGSYHVKTGYLEDWS